MNVFPCTYFRIWSFPREKNTEGCLFSKTASQAKLNLFPVIRLLLFSYQHVVCFDLSDP